MVMSKSLIATPPGMTIKEQLLDRSMSQKEFAARMDLSEKHVSRLINGEVQLTPEVAMRLETVLGIPAAFWNNLEAIYRESLVRIKDENDMDDDIELARKFPYFEMAEYGWIAETRNAKEKAVNLRHFFGVAHLSLLENKQITNIACRRLKITEKGDLALMAWAQEARIESRCIQTSPINIKKLISIIPEIRNMTLLMPDDFSSDLQAMMSECGVALVFLPHLKGSFLQGATFYDGNRIVMGLTLRGKDADIFWFSFFHELAHIILGHIGDVDGLSDTEEHDADKWAADTLIDPKEYAVFCEEGVFSRMSIIEFAKVQSIASGIVVGRLQREGFIPHNSLNDLKLKYSIA